MPPHPLTNFEIIDYFKDESRFNGVYSRNDLPNIQKGTHVINLQDSLGPGTYWVVVFVKKNEVIYFDSFGVEYIPREIEKSVGNKNIKTNLFRIIYNSVMRGYICILFVEFMLKSKTLTDFSSLFSPWDFKKNNEIISRYFR